MRSSEYATYDATGLSQLVQKGEVSSSEVVQASLSLAEKLNPEINALVEVWWDDPIQSGGPFAGVPFVVKDIGLTAAGRKMEFGSRLARGLRFEEDSDLMGRFRRAGLTAVGRSAIPEFAASVTTEPVLGGPVHNPWNLNRSAGGSSGGAAAAVAAGIVPLAHATDAGGSIRVPASCTGLVGLKPSRGRVAMGPAMDEVWGGLAAQFVLTRSVRDSATLLDLLEGPNVGEPFIIARPAEPYLQAIDQASKPLRIGYLEHPANGNCTAEPVARVLSDTAYLLQQLGHHVEPATFDLGVSWEAFTVAVGRYWIAHNAAFMRFLASATARSVDLTTVEPATLAMFHQGSVLKAIDLIAAAEIRNQVTRAVGRFHTGYDVLLTPTLPNLPMPLGRLHAGVDDLDGLGWVARVLDSAPFSSLANMSGTPAISLPLGQDSATGLPIGMQFGAGFGKEDVLLRLAAELERAAPWAERHPLIWGGIM
jgi:amidase